MEGLQLAAESKKGQGRVSHARVAISMSSYRSTMCKVVYHE